VTFTFLEEFFELKQIDDEKVGESERGGGREGNDSMIFDSIDN
jgi:hypothetical protein